MKTKMKTKKTTRQRKINPYRLFFSIVFIVWLIASLFIKTSNASLTMEIQKLNDELSVLTTENETLNLQIQSLENKDRIYEVAQTSNMDQVQDNIISIVGE